MQLDDPSAIYAIRGDTRFAAYGYGASNYDSYGWPLVGSTADLSKPDVWKPTLKYTMDCDGNVMGRVFEEPRDVDSLRSNLASIKMIGSESYNYKFDFNVDDFIPGETSILDWILKVEDEATNAKATLLFADRAGNEIIEVIEYKATKFKISPRITNWGQLAYNEPASSKELILINESEKAVVVDSIMILSKDTDRKWEENGFRLDMSVHTDATLPIEMQAGEELKFNVIFDPAVVQDEIIKGKSFFIDSVGIKAYWSDDMDGYCYYRYIGALKATINIITPTLITPANNSTNISMVPIFEWESIATATKYNIEVSTDPTFNTTFISEEITSNTYTAMSFLKNETTYYWRVNAMNDNQTSDWSVTWSFTTEEASAVNDENAIANNNIQIVPNPAKENITIIADFILTSAKIYSMTGNLVLGANTHTIDVSQLPHGTYLLVIEAENKTERAMFIKE